MKNSKKVLMNITLLEEFRRKDEGSYLDCFMPLVCTCLAEDDSDVIDYNKLHARFAKNFVTNIPKHSMKAILKRAKQKGILIQNGSVLTKNMDFINKMQTQSNKALKKIELAQDKMIKEFQQFALTKYQKAITEIDFLNSFTSYMQKHFMDYLKLDIVETQLTNKDHARDMEYMISMFLKEKWLETKELPEFIETNIQGFYLANYIGYFDSNLHERMKAFNVYIDTPIIMGLLGWNGKTASKFYSELFDALKKQEVSLFILENTVDEIKGVLRGYMKALRNQHWESFNPSTLRYIRNNMVTHEAIERDVLILENSLKSQGIKIVETPERTPSFQMDEEKFKRTLINAGYDEFKQNTNIDVDHVAAIHQLRQGKFIDHNSNLVPLFFTDNNLLVNSAVNFFKNEDDEHSSTIPHCVTDSFLSSLLLLRIPSVMLNISKKKLIAEAFATIHTNSDFWQKVYKRVEILAKDKMLSESDYQIFRYSSELHAYIADQKIVQNLHPDDFDAEKIHDLLNNFKADLTKDKDKVIKEYEAENEALLASNANLTSTNKTLVVDNDNLKTKILNTLDGQPIVKWVSNGLAVTGSIVFFAAVTAISFVDKFSNEMFGQQAHIAKGVGYFSWFLVSLFCLNIKVVKQGLEKWLEPRVFAFIDKRARNNKQ